MWTGIKRTISPAIILLVMLVLLRFAPEEKTGYQLFIYKVMLANAGFLNAHIVRKLAFYAADWQHDTHKSLKLLITALYVVFIYVYAMGG